MKPTLEALIAAVPAGAVIAVDVPIGLMDRGSRACDQIARQQLKPHRHNSVFSAPIRAVLEATSYLDACATRQRIDGVSMSKQAYAIVPKIREVDELLRRRPDLQQQVKEVHPEVCFTAWNGGTPMGFAKKTREGKAERDALIEAWLPDLYQRFVGMWPRSQVARDDLNDAFAALWTAERIAAGTAIRIPSADPPRDAFGLPMEMWA
jgi:predicted RNase H-like nuclease